MKCLYLVARKFTLLFLSINPTPSSNTIINLGRLSFGNCNCKTDYNEIDKTINGIRETQLQLPKDKRPRLMLVLDDGVGLIERNSNVNFLATRYRHFNLNMIMSVQSFRACSPVMRVNANYLILMNGIMNTKELEKVEEAVSYTHLTLPTTPYV